MAKERLIVIGGDAARMGAASQAKRRSPELDTYPIFTGLGPGRDRCPRSGQGALDQSFPREDLCKREL